MQTCTAGAQTLSLTLSMGLEAKGLSCVRALAALKGRGLERFWGVAQGSDAEAYKGRGLVQTWSENPH